MTDWVPVRLVNEPGRRSVALRIERAIRWQPSFKKLAFAGVNLCVLMCTVLMAFKADAAHIVVGKEVLLEASHPRVIVRAPDGNYVIAGRHDYSAWATKVAVDGTVIWRHELPGSTANPCCDGTEYRGVTFLEDGSTMLCGVIDVSTKAIGNHNHRNVIETKGIISRLNERGELLHIEQIVAPGRFENASTDIGFNVLDQCLATKDGIVVVGDGIHQVGPLPENKTSYFNWLVKLNKSGVITSNILLLPAPADFVAGAPMTLFEQAKGEFLITTNDHVFRFSSDGKVGAGTEFEIPIRLKDSIDLPMRGIAAGRSSDVSTFDSNLKLVNVKPGKDWGFIRMATFRLPDGSLASFGSTQQYGGTAAIEWISKDYSVEEMEIPMPTHGSGSIEAVATTKVSNEFATVRLLIPGLRHRVGADETRSGILLSFVQFK